MKTILEMSKLAIDRFFDRYTVHSIHGTRTGLHYYFKVFDIFYLKEDLWGKRDRVPEKFFLAKV